MSESAIATTSVIIVMLILIAMSIAVTWYYRDGNK
jgi:Flp pilus assembly protein TadG